MWDGVDRRKFCRAEYPCLVTLRRTMHAPLSVLTHTEDISVIGVNIIVSKKFDIMSEIDVELDLKDTLPSMQVKGVIRWISEVVSETPGKESRFRVGVKFIQIGDSQRRRIQAIVDHFESKGKKSLYDD